MAHHPISGLGRPHCWSYYIAHTLTHSYPLGLLWTSDQPITEATTYTTSKEHNRRTSMPPAGSEPFIPAIERPQAYVLEYTATWIGKCEMSVWDNGFYLLFYMNVELYISCYGKSIHGGAWKRGSEEKKHFGGLRGGREGGEKLSV